MNDLKDALSGLYHFKGRMTLALFLGLLTIVSGVGLIAASGYLISWAALRPPILDMILVLVAVRFFGISRAAFRYAERLFSHDLTFRILKNLRVKFYEKVEPLLPAKAIRYRSADLLNRFSEDVDQLQELYLKTIAPSITALFFIITTTLILSLYSVALSLTVFILMIANSVLMPFLIRAKAGQSARELSASHAGLSQYMNDHIQGTTDLMFSGMYENWMRSGENLIDRIAKVQKKRAGAFSMESGLFILLSHASIPISFLFLLPFVLDGSISGLVMTAIILGLFSVFEALEPMGNAMQHFYESKEAAGRLNEITSENEVDSRVQKGSEFNPENPSVRFKNVTFTYKKDVPVLRGLNLDIQPREHVLIQGASGCGKSTMTYLLVKWFEPDHGEILIGGQQIATVKGSEVRKQISVVGQHTRLFNTTLRNNLKIAKPEATDEELFDVLEKVSFGETLKKLPDGLSTQVGELGLRLSGGERQRVSLARALLKDAPIWILDEPLSSLGREMAEEIMKTISELTIHKTVLHITHRNSGIMHADRVYELTDGNLIEIKQVVKSDSSRINQI